MKLFSSLLAARYDVGVLSAPVEAVIWTAEAIAAEYGAAIARKALSAVNRRRASAGRMPAFVPYGHPLF